MTTRTTPRQRRHFQHMQHKANAPKLAKAEIVRMPRTAQTRKPRHITQAAADAIARRTIYGDQIDDSEQTDYGFVYTLDNGKWLKVFNDRTYQAQR